MSIINKKEKRDFGAKKPLKIPRGQLLCKSDRFLSAEDPVFGSDSDQALLPGLGVHTVRLHILINSHSVVLLLLLNVGKSVTKSGCCALKNRGIVNA